MTITMPRMDRLPARERGLTIGDFLVPIRVSDRMHTRVRHIALVAIGVLLIALGAKISILLPDNPVPITGQTFGVLVAGGALGFRRGIAAAGIYVLLGVVGLPFFAFGDTGIQILWGARGGYLIGFIVAAAIVGRLAELGWDRNILGAIGAMLIANAAIYVDRRSVAGRYDRLRSPRRPSRRASWHSSSATRSSWRSRPPRSRSRGGSSAAGRETARPDRPPRLPAWAKPRSSRAASTARRARRGA